MFLKISLNLDIQTQYVDLLRNFQDSQHKALQYGEYQDVFQLEVTIQRVLRTLQLKRQELREELTGDTVREFASRFPKYIGDMLREKLDRLESVEEDAMAKATRNADLAMILAGMKPGNIEDWTFHSPVDSPVDSLGADAFSSAVVEEMVQ